MDDLGGPRARPHWFAWLLLVALLLLPALGLYPLLDDDEGAFGEATRELLAGGDWLSTTLNGAPRYDKPILIYWLQALSVSAFGLGEFSLRLPSALAAIAWVASIARFAAPRLRPDGAGGGLLAAWVAATSLGVLVIARAATADALLNALLAAAMFDGWRHLERGDRGALRRMYLWIALGLLTKGPIALLVPAAVSLLYCTTSGRWRDWRRAVLDPSGWLILLAVAAPWYAAQWFLHGRDFIDGFLVKHNLDRYAGALEQHGGGFGYYLVFVPLLLLPWTGLLPGAAAALREDWRAPLTRFLWLWFGFVLVFFSLSGTKLPHYLLYGMTPLFLLLARAGGRIRRPAAVLAWPTLLLAVTLAAPWLLQHWADLPNPAPDLYRLLARRSLAALPAGYLPLAAGALVLWATLLAAGRMPAARRLAAGAGLLAMVFSYALAPWLGEVLAGPIKRAALVAAARTEPVVVWNMHAPSFSVYRRQATPARAPMPGELALTRADRLPPDADVERLFDEGGILLVRQR